MLLPSTCSHLVQMLSKRSLGYNPQEEESHKRFRHNVNDLLLGNDVSAARAHSLFVDAEAAGVANVGDMARCGRRGKYPGNLHREMLGKLVKRSQWPKPYYGEVRVFDRKNRRMLL